MRGICLGICLILSQHLFAATEVIIPASGRDDAQVYVPTLYSAAKSWPVILLLHGYTSNGPLMDLYFGMSAQVDTRGFILVVPNGKMDSHGFRYWNATEGCCDFDHTNSDDVGYLKGLLADVESRYNVDRARVYVAGHSNGGFMSYRLACEPNSEFSKIVSFAGETFANPAECKATHPVSVMQIHALDDDTILYAGDPVGYSGLAPYPGTLQTLAQWVGIDGCQPTLTALPSIEITVANQTRVQEWSNCAAGTRIRLDEIQAQKGPLESPHTPLLTGAFTQNLLDFLL